MWFSLSLVSVDGTIDARLLFIGGDPRGLLEALVPNRNKCENRLVV